jgi:hypothetical protein
VVLSLIRLGPKASPSQYGQPGAPDVVRHKNQVIDEWCAKVGRDPRQIERTTNIPTSAIDRIPEYVEAGAQRLQLQLDHPFDLKPVEQALKQRG